MLSCAGGAVSALRSQPALFAPALQPLLTFPRRWRQSPLQGLRCLASASRKQRKAAEMAPNIGVILGTMVRVQAALYVCMSVCLSVCLSVCMYVCMYLYVCMCVCVCMYIYVCICVCMCMRASVCRYSCTCFGDSNRCLFAAEHEHNKI